MSDLSINIDQAQIKALVSEGILAQLTDDARQDILKQAVVFLLTPPKPDRYSAQTESPLQMAFDSAARGVVHDVVRDLVGNDEEFKQKIREAVGDALMSMRQDYSGLQQKIADAIGELVVAGWRSS